MRSSCLAQTARFAPLPVVKAATAREFHVVGPSNRKSNSLFVCTYNPGTQVEWVNMSY